MQKDPLIVEDLTLLMFDDASGAIAGAGTLYYTQGGAVLVELAQAGRLRVDRRDVGMDGVRVHAVAGAPLSDPVLREAHRKVSARTRGVNTLLIEIGTGLREAVLDRLVERGMVRRERKKVLGLFPTTSLSAADTRHKQAVLERVRAVLVDEEEPDARTAALIGLLSASGTLPSLHRVIPWSGKVYQRAKRLEQDSWGAEAVNTAVLRTLAAVTVGTVTAATTN
ncbi:MULTISPECIES: GOLPH3/VPS74 family protein [Streptomyces]|uniref:GPP34 family phosphoprotein n=1 Tax=Streptomyces parvulus TaxID=146923 RepID=A0ABV5D839_9ACTN|nr:MULTISPECIES: GPP34 family phosphoprotein [unclassified Streptomyces]WHM29998.1 GPP34 family phosphoprotein [Streptomyces sp. BPPL-273]WML83197.1 GPP34 family phosphoprotein [Streptomyces sp. VNUA74]